MKVGDERTVDDPFGGLPIIPENERAEPGAHSDTCYICRDPSYAERGLPLCRACPACGGHVAADDNVCFDCGLVDQWFWELLPTWTEEPPTGVVEQFLLKCFQDMNYEQKTPTDAELAVAVAAMYRLLDDQRGRSGQRPGGPG